VFILLVIYSVILGVDPVWNRAMNELQFLNSYKMKISVIFGVTQMLVGILLKAVNSAIFRKPFDFFFEFLP
jgi:V-type H+-transporting ATPase subunit a